MTMFKAGLVVKNMDLSRRLLYGGDVLIIPSLHCPGEAE